MSHDRSSATPEEAHVHATSLEKVGGVYGYIAAAVRYYNPVSQNYDIDPVSENPDKEK